MCSRAKRYCTRSFIVSGVRTVPQLLLLFFREKAVYSCGAILLNNVGTKRNNHPHIEIFRVGSVESVIRRVTTFKLSKSYS